VNNVVDLAEYRVMREKSNIKKEEKPANSLSGSGPAKCLACKHEWMAVAGAGDDMFDLVCPECDTRRGQFIYPPNLDKGHITWQHKCGSIHFTPIFLKSDGHIAKRQERS
jgi:hypothetical protein